MPASVPAPALRQFLRAALLGGCLALGACSHLSRLGPSHWHLPWRHAAAGPEVANELVVEGSEQGLPQVWVRNTVQVDLSGLAGEGSLVLRRAPGHDWPIRLAFVARPGSFGHLELRGDQRVLLAVPAEGAPAVLAVPPGVYSPNTPSIALKYGP